MDDYSRLDVMRDNVSEGEGDELVSGNSDSGGIGEGEPEGEHGELDHG